MKIRTKLCLGFSFTLLGALPALPANVMPDLAGAPTGWTVDRYQPDSFADAGTVHGLDNVLQIGISSAEDSANRGAQSGTFANTQGMSHSVTGGVGDDVAVQVYIPSSYGDSANGDVKTDLWLQVDGASPYYGILGFTNFGTNNRAGDTTATFQYWDDGVAAQNWTSSSATVQYDAWNTLDIQYDGTSITYLINGAAIGTVNDLGADANNAIGDVLLQAYNYGDPNFGASYGNSAIVPNNTADYVVDFANVAAAPEPASLSLLGFGLAGLAFVVRRNRRSA